MRTIIASGTGRYADPWHPFPKTSRLLAEILRDTGHDVAVADVDEAMCGLDDADLLVVNAGDPWRNGGRPAAVPPPGVDEFARALVRGISVLAVHNALSSLRDYPEWPPAIGAMWVPGISSHPPGGEFQVTGLTTPDGDPVQDFWLFDERYHKLQPLGQFHTVAKHTIDDAAHPTAWTRTHGSSRVAVDTLGHDERSYDSEGHRELIRTLVNWLAPGCSPCR